MLEALERGNLFVVPLDDRRQWYRYHHLFADVLQARLRDEQPDEVAELHRRASDWYEQNGERSEAIRHALAGERFRASGRPGRAGDACVASGNQQDATLRDWLRGSARRGDPGPAGADHRVCRGPDGQGRGRGRRGAPARCRTVAGRDGGSRPGPGEPSAKPVVVDEEPFRPSACSYRLLPGRIGSPPRRCGRHHDPLPTGARPCR